MNDILILLNVANNHCSILKINYEMIILFELLLQDLNIMQVYLLMHLPLFYFVSNFNFNTCLGLHKQVFLFSYFRKWSNCWKGFQLSYTITTNYSVQILIVIFLKLNIFCILYVNVILFNMYIAIFLLNDVYAVIIIIFSFSKFFN